MNDGLISITITITKTITTTITITKTFFFFKKSLRASDVEAEPKFPSDLLHPVLIFLHGISLREPYKVRKQKIVWKFPNLGVRHR